MTGPLYVGFDAGTQSVKVALYDATFSCVCAHSHPTTLSTPAPGRVEMNADEYVALTIQGLKECIDELPALGYDAKDIRAVMGDGIICGIVGVDENGNAVTPYLNYLDSRNVAAADSLNASEHLPLFARETGNAQASPMFPALFARWFIENDLDFQARGVKFVHNAPYILMHLAGLKAEDAFIDWGAMSGWGLGYNVEEKAWSPEQLKVLGLSIDQLPRIVRPWDQVGTITKAISQATGLPEGTPVLGGAGDTMQSMLGSGITAPFQGVDVAGTCAMFCVSTRGIVPELSRPENGLIFNAGTLPNTYFYWGFVRTGGLALRWFKDNVCLSDDETLYERLSEEAAKRPAGNDGVLFLPYLTGGTGELSGAAGTFFNLTLDDDQYTMWRAVLEGIAFDYRELFDIYKRAGVPLETLTVTEGGARDPLWNQIKSDMLNTPVKRNKNIGGAVLTNALVAAYAVGDIEAIEPLLLAQLEEDAHWTPVPEATRTYDQMAKARSELLKTQLPTLFSALSALRPKKG